MYARKTPFHKHLLERKGEEGGHALWNILNGTVNPSGHTAHTWPRTVGQVHMYVPHYLEQRTRPPSSQFADYAPATPLVPSPVNIRKNGLETVDPRMNEILIQNSDCH